MNKYIYIFLAVIIAGLVFSIVLMSGKIKTIESENEFLKQQSKNLSDSYVELSKSFNEIRKQKTYSIQLAPNVNSKISAVFGSAKQLTLQYYFTMDGNKIEIIPDSVYSIQKIE